MSNIVLKVFWSNNPMPVDQKIIKSDFVINVPFGSMIAHPSQSVKSVNHKIGDVLLNAADVGADSIGTSETLRNTLEPQIQNLSQNKLDKIDFIQHFRGLFSSYAALTAALPMALDGDYAHIESGSGFDRMSAIWDSSDHQWIVNNVNVGANTDEMPEGSNNLYFKSERVLQTPLSGLTTQVSEDINPSDSILSAIAKLQAQINNEDEPVNWINIKTLGQFDAAIDLNRTKIEFANIKGDFWVRGYIVFKSDLPTANHIFVIQDSAWFVDAAPTGTAVIFGLLQSSRNGTLFLDYFHFEQVPTLNALFLRGNTSAIKNTVYNFNTVNVGKLINQ